MSRTWRRITLATIAGLLALVIFQLSRLRVTPPSVDSYDSWISTVEKGSMVLEVRGQGLLISAQNPSKLVARVNGLDSRAGELRLNQSAEIDTRKEMVKGHVNYVSPSPSNELRTVDIAVDSPLPAGVGANL